MYNNLNSKLVDKNDDGVGINPPLFPPKTISVYTPSKQFRSDEVMKFY